jgi:hypothetical protein
VSHFCKVKYKDLSAVYDDFQGKKGKEGRSCLDCSAGTRTCSIVVSALFRPQLFLLIGLVVDKRGSYLQEQLRSS